MRFFVFILLYFLCSLQALGQDLETPLFIDGVTCQYSADELNKESEQLLKQFSNQEIGKLNQKVFKINVCEILFSDYNIYPLVWVNPTKLKLAITAMENTYLFKSVKVEIIPSKKENHIYLKASFESHQSKHHVEANYYLHSEKGRNDERDRKTQSWELHYKFLYSNRKIKPVFDLYLKRDTSTADNPVLLSNKEVDELNDLQKVSLGKKNNSYTAFGFEGSVPKLWNGADVSLGVLLNSNKLTGDEEATLSGKSRLGFGFNKSMKYLIDSLVYELYFESINREIPVNENVEKNDDKKRANGIDGSDYYVGLKVDVTDDNWYQLSIDYRRLIDKELQYYLYEKIYWPFSRFSFGHLSLGLEFEKNYQYSGIEKRFVLPFYTQSSYFIGGGLDFNIGGSKQSIQLTVGNRNMSSDKNGNLDGYSRSSKFIEANYIIHHDHFTTKLGFLAGERLY